MPVELTPGDTERLSAGYDSVRFSRTQGILSAAALGGNIIIGIGTFIAGAQLIQQSGSDTPLVFFVATLLFLPIIFSCLQRSSSAISSAGFYAAARASGSAVRLFFTMWLMLAGYLAVGALLAYGAGARLTLGMNRVFGWNIQLAPTIAVIVAGLFIKQLLTQKESWRTRNAVFWSCLSFLIALLVWGVISHLRASVTVSKTEPVQHWLLSVCMLASTLWSIDIILNYRGQLQRPNHTIGWALVVVYCGGNLLGGLTAATVLHNPSLIMKNWLDALSWQQSRLEILILIAGLLICLSGLARVVTRITRVLGNMMVDGALPHFSENLEQSGKTLRLYLVAICACIASLAIFLSISYLLLISAFAALLSIVLYLHPLLKKDVSRLAGFSLPLHPLIPALSIVLAIFLMWILPLQDLMLIGVWLAVGALLFFTISRKSMLPALQQERVLAEAGAESARAKYCVLACFSDEQINESLVRVGAALARANQGELLVLRILETSELLPGNLQRKFGESEWQRLRDALQKLKLPQHPIPVVRMAPDLIAGIKATAREFAANFILMEWPDETVERLRKSQLLNSLQLTAKPLGILKGSVNDSFHTISIASGNSAHARQAYQVGESLASIYGSKLEAVRIFSKSESDHDATDGVHKTMQESGIQVLPQIAVYQENDVVKGILKATENSDLLLMGASDDPLTGRPLPDGHSVDIALQRNHATLIVKSKEEASKFLMHRIVNAVTSKVASLTQKERSELLGQLKVGLQARADFYFMVGLAAAIAITGLIMNDGSIVLGAMLVSPLMSPIVGIACGIALGNIDLMRRSSASTFKGMAVVLGVGVVMTFLLPTVEPTTQILSRTTPGIFDLLAALAAGAAGAYSLGRKSVAGALPGVAMSLSLEPPLATAGYGLSTSQFWITGGAFLLFLTNLAAIVLSGVSVYLLLGMRPTRKESLYVVGKAVAAVMIVTLVLIVPLGFGTYGVLQRGHLKFQVESEFRQAAVRERFQLLELKIEERENGFLIRPTVLASEEVTPEKIEKFRKAVESRLGSPIQIEATILQTKRVESPTAKEEISH